MSKRVLDETSKENEVAKKVVKHSLMHDEVSENFKLSFLKCRLAGNSAFSLFLGLLVVYLSLASTAPVLRLIIYDFSNLDANFLASRSLPLSST